MIAVMTADGPAEHLHLLVLYVGLVLCATFVIFSGFVLFSKASDVERSAQIIRVGLYLWSYAFLILLSMLVWSSGGVFESKFSWLYEVSFVVTLQIGVFAVESERWKSPLSLAAYVFILLFCIELWPDRPHQPWTSTHYFANWLHIVTAILMIALVQALVEFFQNREIPGLSRLPTQSSNSKKSKKFIDQ